MSLVLATYPRRIGTFIFLDEEGLVFRDTSDRRVYKWQNIRHIYHLDRYNDLKVIDKEGQTSVGRVLSDENFSNIPEKIKCIWEMWRNRITDAEKINTFKYPDLSSQKDAISVSSILLGGSFFRGFLIFFLLLGIIDPRVLILALILLLCQLWSAVPNLIELRRVKVKVICFYEGGLDLIYDDNRIKTFNISNIEEYNLEEPRKAVMIVFSDGTKLKNLDRFSYWVVLREHLLSKLHSPEKT
jgi:hypothetical protein